MLQSSFEHPYNKPEWKVVEVILESGGNNTAPTKQTLETFNFKNQSTS